MSIATRSHRRRFGIAAVLVAAGLTPIGAAAPAVATVTVTPSIAVHSNVDAAVTRSKTAKGWTPPELAAAYKVNWSPSLGAGQTIAIVDAYDSPTAEADLGVFSKAMGLPACTTANGCFTKVNQAGAASPLPPNYNQTWATEINLDTQWVHAMAPGARIVLIETANDALANLAAAEQYANLSTNATYISNSWGVHECQPGEPYGCITPALEQTYGGVFVPAAGKSIFVASGDYGLMANFPAAAPTVISVGGTTLKASRTVSEFVWACGKPTKSKPNQCPYTGGGGGGCSAYFSPAPAQAAFAQYSHAGCAGRRATPDLAAVSDPDTGVPVYMSSFGKAGYQVVGGTSLATPVVAAFAADSGHALDAATIYGSTMTFRDANTKKAKDPTNGAPCLTGYDMCTGRGAWINAVS